MPYALKWAKTLGLLQYDSTSAGVLSAAATSSAPSGSSNVVPNNVSFESGLTMRTWASSSRSGALSVPSWFGAATMKT